jgi:catechol 2,3-dioxygenase-like lactoylglutathione lyase family enzyme
MVLPNGQFRVLFSPKDYPASVAFYRDGLGLPIDHDWDYGAGDYGTVFLAGGGMIELLGLAPDAGYVKPEGINLIIQVDDADRWLQLARTRKLNIVREPTSYPWGHRVLRLADPDGIMISLFALIPPAQAPGA